MANEDSPGDTKKFVVTFESVVVGSKCLKCGSLDHPALYFGHLDDGIKWRQVVISGVCCSRECATDALWKKYCVERLRGEWNP